MSSGLTDKTYTQANGILDLGLGVLDPFSRFEQRDTTPRTAACAVTLFVPPICAMTLFVCCDLIRAPYLYRMLIAAFAIRCRVLGAPCPGLFSFVAGQLDPKPGHVYEFDIQPGVDIVTAIEGPPPPPPTNPTSESKSRIKSEISQICNLLCGPIPLRPLSSPLARFCTCPYWNHVNPALDWWHLVITAEWADPACMLSDH